MKLKVKYAPRRDGSFGQVLGYKIGADGTVDVSDEHAEILLGTDNFERAEPSKGSAGDAMLIQNGDQTIDLMTLGKAELMALANDEMGLALHPNTGEAKIRTAIVEFCNQDE